MDFIDWSNEYENIFTNYNVNGPDNCISNKI